MTDAFSSNAEDLLRTLYPHGHKGFVALCVKEMQTHSSKNRDYAGGGPPLGNFERVAAILDMYPGLRAADPQVVAMIYLLKHLDAVLWQWSANLDPTNDTTKERLLDISVYIKLITLMGQP